MALTWPLNGAAQPAFEPTGPAITKPAAMSLSTSRSVKSDTVDCTGHNPCTRQKTPGGQGPCSSPAAPSVTRPQLSSQPPAHSAAGPRCLDEALEEITIICPQNCKAIQQSSTAETKFSIEIYMASKSPLQSFLLFMLIPVYRLGTYRLKKKITVIWFCLISNS